MPPLLRPLLAPALAFLRVVIGGEVCETSSPELANSPSLLQTRQGDGLPVSDIHDIRNFAVRLVGNVDQQSKEASNRLDDVGFAFHLPSKAEVAAINASWWVPLEPPPDPKGKPKLAVLMMTGDTIKHTKLWEAWLEDGKRLNLSVNFLVHAEGGRLSSAPRQAVLVPRVIPTEWCDIYDAEMYMLGQALLDPAVTHMAIVSGDSVPLQRASAIYDQLDRDASSRLCFDLAFRMVRAETWMLLRRSDAQLFWKWREKTAQEFKLGCTEENGWLYPLLVRSMAGTGHRPLNECVMFTDWTDTSKKAWRAHAAELNLTATRSQPYKAATGVHPRTYLHIDAASWAELQGTHFWFGRKFAAEAFADLRPPYGFGGSLSEPPVQLLDGGSHRSSGGSTGRWSRPQGSSSLLQKDSYLGRSTVNLTARRKFLHRDAAVGFSWDDATNTSWWVDLPQPPDPKGKPKLAVVMFVGDTVDHVDLWEAWLAQGKRLNLSVNFHVHAKNGTLSQAPRQAILAPVAIPTHWCNIYDAELYMMGQALQDPAVTHVAVVSSDSVPLRPLAWIHHRLEEDVSSRLCFDLLFWKFVRAETWMLLRRSDAQLFWERRQDVARLFKVGCSEENGWLYPLLLRNRVGSGPAPLDSCVMFADWTNTAETEREAWRRHTVHKHLPSLRSEPHEDGQGHPRNFLHVGPRSWAELRGMDFWFGRKFASGAFSKLKPPYGFD